MYTTEQEIKEAEEDARIVLDSQSVDEYIESELRRCFSKTFNEFSFNETT